VVYFGALFFNDTENLLILILIAIDNMGTYMYGKKDGLRW